MSSIKEMINRVLGRNKPPEDTYAVGYDNPFHENTSCGINEDLVEMEVLKRVRFKMLEFQTSLSNIDARLRHHFKDGDALKENTRLADALDIVKERLDKEIHMGGIHDGQFEENLVKGKNELVDAITKSLLKRGDVDYQYKQSRVNNLIESHIYQNNL